MRIAILHDVVPPGAPPDQLDALVQAEAVREVLVGDGHDARVRAFDRDPGALLAERPDLVFNLVESVDGVGSRAHLATAMFELLGLRFTGSGTTTLALSTDKIAAKRLLSAFGHVVPRDWPEGGPRWIVKSRWEDASIGIDDSNVVSGAEVPAAVERLSPRLGGDVVVETYVDGRELNISVLETEAGPVALPVAEIRFALPPGRERIVGYAAKWAEDSVEYASTHRTFDVDGLDTADLARRSVDAFRRLGLRGYGRVDWRVADDGTAYVLELNANPCLAPDAGFPAAAARAGLDYPDMVRAVVAAALR